MDGEGTRSLGTIEPACIAGVTFAPKPWWGKWEYRLAFADATGRAYNLAVTDLAYRSFLDYLRDVEELEPFRVARHLLATLREAEHVFLQVGLARGWHDDEPRRCHLQINGVYAFPDYLEGRCFADIAPEPPVRYDPREVPFWRGQGTPLASPAPRGGSAAHRIGASERGGDQRCTRSRRCS